MNTRPRPSRSLALLMCLGVASNACSKDAETPPPRPAGRPLQVARDADIAKADSLTGFRTAYEQAYRLTPDARFTRALALLEQLLTGQPAPKVEARFQEGQWHLLSNGTEVGSLPEFPDFPQALALLEARARQLGTEKLDLQKGADTATPTPPSPPPKKKPAPKSGKRGSRRMKKLAQQVAGNVSGDTLPLGRAAIDVLHQHDRDWAAGKRSVSSVREGTRALVSLAFQLVDLTGTADEVPARALAHLALARVVTGEPLTQEQALLASALGHDRAARQLAETLSAGSPVRLYFLREDARLESLAREQQGLAWYLWLRRASEVGLTERSRRLSKIELDPHTAIHELTALLHGREFDLDRTLGMSLPPLVLREMAAATGRTDAEERAPARKGARKTKGQEMERLLKQLHERFNLLQRGILPAFEEQLALVGNTEGFFLDAGTERAYFQGLFFSAQYRLGLHLLDSFASAEAAGAFSKSLGSGGTPAGKEFQEWMSRLVAAGSGQRVEASLMQSLTELKSFGTAPLLRVYEELLDAADWMDPALSSMARRIAARMDSRPEHRFFLAQIARGTLYDIVLSEKLYRATFEATEGVKSGAWVAWLDRDSAKLQALLDSPHTYGSIRQQVLAHLLESQPVPPEALMTKLAPLLATHGDEWTFTSGCVELLEKHGRYGEARGVVEQWLAQHPNPGGFQGINARTTLARMYQLEGNAQAGWTAMEPALESYQFGAMRQAALLSLDLGEEKRALSLAEAAAGRYPGPKSLTLMAEVLWRTGELEAAAGLLASPQRSLRGIDWRWSIGARFAAVFGKRPVKEGLEAFKALQKKGIGAMELSQLALEVNRAGNPELAFELQSRIDAPGLQKLEMIMDAYRYLKKWKSEKDAVAWLRTRVPKNLLEPLSMFAFREKEDGVLWDVIPLAEGTAETTDYVWLTRAAASTRARDTDAAHQAALRKRFEVDRPGFYHQVGRHLLGLIPEQAVIAAAATARNRQELPYFLGLEAQAEGRYEDAVTWYRAIVETSNPKVGEYQWAYGELMRLKQAELSLALLKQRAQ
ncbi:MAG TPA: hypothetical protein VFZ09_06815 [Archangium sp.]|uniref:tetratricopeptide repeat protein n=1 Tax=Archangium sp. TaxID=1872627 RepID=UPI002E3160C3|nr:hypothetical protein [Archangium sp.]HEX5745937.1 hypothetical protein [Archangium sp.]